MLTPLFYAEVLQSELIWATPAEFLPFRLNTSHCDALFGYQDVCHFNALWSLHSILVHRNKAPHSAQYIFLLLLAYTATTFEQYNFNNVLSNVYISIIWIRLELFKNHFSRNQTDCGIPEETSTLNIPTVSALLIFAWSRSRKVCHLVIKSYRKQWSVFHCCSHMFIRNIWFVHSPRPWKIWETKIFASLRRKFLNRFASTGRFGVINSSQSISPVPVIVLQTFKLSFIQIQRDLK